MFLSSILPCPDKPLPAPVKSAGMEGIHRAPGSLLQRREYFPGFGKSKTFYFHSLRKEKKDPFSSSQPCKNGIDLFLECALPAATFHRKRGL